MSAGLSLYLFSAALPVYLNRTIGYSLQAVGALVALASIVQIAATLGAGPLVDQRGARLAIRLGSACYLAAAVLYLASTSLLAIGLARVLQGIGIALVLPGVFSLAPALAAHGSQGTAIGFIGAFNNVALAIGPPLGLLLLVRGPDTLFVAALVAGAVGILVSALMDVGSPVAEPGRLLKYRVAWTPLYAITFLSVVYWGVVTAFLPIEVARGQLANVGWFFAADALAVMATRLPSGYLADRFGSRWLLVAGAVATGAGIALLMLRASLATLLIAGIATGVGAALLLPPVILELTKRSDDTDRGTAIALYNTSFAAAIAAGSLGGAVIVVRFSFMLSLLLSLLSCLACVPIALATVHAIEDH